ncbi:transcriptional regulator [Actinobacillus porcitonsillarum]|uniref:Transcriptional regulator n=1 Tax=Actinobacillus porcitonsillarum TaxID=189834 RepID=A0A2U8FLB5_9PAST|nr:S24 family peptidase [Actinobacillus porcitonsillarum]AWI51830.1 transcriptional regulator [Actinobacillus porcitonsillarum]
MASLKVIKKASSYQPIPLYRDINPDHERSIKLDLNSLCIKRPTDTFFILIKNPNLIAWGIELDDLVIVEKSQQYYKNDLLVLEKEGDYKFYQFFNEVDGEIILFSLDIHEKNLRLKDWNEVNVAGVITNIVHQMRQRFSTSQEKRYVA